MTAGNGKTQPAIGAASKIVPALLALILLAAFALRWDGIGTRSISHPEIYVPGIELSDESSVPPPRTEFMKALGWHFAEEPHPVGWYMAMFGWTRVFGDSETSLRAPSVIFGTLTALLVFLLTARLYGRRAGLIAAAIIAFSGFEIYWGGIARMYAPGAFLAVLSTGLLIRLTSDGKRPPATGALYVLATALSLQTTELCWAVFGAQIFWTALFAANRPDGKAAVAPVLQALTLMVSAPALLQAAYTARGGAADAPTLQFLAHYLALGVAFEPDFMSVPARTVATPIVLAAAAFSLAMLVLAFSRRSAIKPTAAPSGVKFLALVGAALLATAFMAFLVSIAKRRETALAVIATLPLLALALAPVSGAVRAVSRRLAPAIDAFIARLDPQTVLFALIGVAAPLGVFVISLWKPVTEFRAFIVFTPFYAMLVGVGLARLSVRPALFALPALALAAFLTISVIHAKGRPTTPRDYKAIAAAMLAGERGDEVFFIRRSDWMDAPVTYYLPHPRIIGRNYAERLKERGARRVWLVRWAELTRTPADDAIDAALQGYERCRKVSARRADAYLYVREDAGGCGAP